MLKYYKFIKYIKMNQSNCIVFKMGNKIVFKDSLQSLKPFTNQNYQVNNNINNRYQTSYYQQQNNFNNKKRSYQGMDVIPKFIANDNMKEINRELLDRLLTKKKIFNKMVISYFSEREEYFSNSIQEVETEMNRYKDMSENNKNKDYEGFMDLLSFMNSNRTNMNLTSMQNISLNDYRNIDNDTKKIILGGIYENKPTLAQRLNLKSYERNNIQNRSNSMSNNKINNLNNNINGNRLSFKNIITKEQMELFRTFIGNPRIPENHIISYFDLSHPKVILAANKYFKNIYGLDYLTLYYVYPAKGQAGTKIHKFRFIGEISDLFTAAQNDYISVVNPRLYLENGNEIRNDRKVKCIGALNLSNNSKIKVVY